ncbi:MAG: tetratricopeptide repeat protein [Actinobacteria bacterium]|nr:tetratricopeptide repeat protein [Actinomycetota bacterium]
MANDEEFPALADGEEGPYEWFVQASRLVDDGRSADAALLFSRVVLDDPTSRSAWEGLARARFDAGEYERAEQAFNRLVELAPDDDYAHFGLGLALWRMRRFPEARDHLGMALVMRPERTDYASALRQVKATLAARREAGLPPVGQSGESLSSGPE